jgi:hypothetical protein
MRWVFIFFVFILFGCTSTQNQHEQKLKDTIEALRKRADFKPLDSAEAYNFINKYYLPRLDTLSIKRKLSIFPLKPIDFKMRFTVGKEEMEAKFKDDTVLLKKSKYQLEPIDYGPDTTHPWDKKLLKATIVLDTLKKSGYSDWRTQWWKVYGPGYMCISYPQYNANTKRLVIREWMENADICGTGHDRIFWYSKTANGWKAD